MKAIIRLYHIKRVQLELNWDNKHIRYLAVAVISGILNVATYLGLTHLTDVAYGKWYAVVVGGTVGYFGHKIVSYGYGEPFSWWMIPKFIGGMITGAGVYAVVTWGLAILFWFLPYIAIHVAAMFIGFLFFQQWNLRFVFKKVARPASSDSPAVIRVELTDE